MFYNMKNTKYIFYVVKYYDIQLYNMYLKIFRNTVLKVSTFNIST